MSTLFLLFDKKGRRLEKPKPIYATLTWDANSGKALALQDGKVVAELHHARVLAIESNMVRLMGMEPIVEDRYRLQEWCYYF